ncbi:hypothetical protein POPTR_008G224801v4 [Populus trichocarpa]|uniref:Uncharacterized protein n=1 Tax=Populus trichocarpa TaxID=3694 RepID=A0ACC0SNI5_POPTR|nr:hypothetical protein POPTR_008G224801v4 [Populus trichocarpa]
MAGVDTTRSQLNGGTPAARLPRPATSGWPLQRLASPTQGAGQNAGGQGPKAAPPRAREQASRGCRLPRPATSGWPLQRLASPPQWAGQNAGGQGPKAARDGEQASRGSPCFRQPSMAAGAAGRHARAPKRPSAQGPPRAPGPQAPAPSAGARARVVFLGKRSSPAGKRVVAGRKTGRRRPENGSSPAGKRVVDAGETSGHEAPHFTRPDSSPAPAADSADFAGAADSTTAPTVSKPALFRQRVPCTNFPVWPGQSIVQPMFVEKSALPIFPHVGMAAAAPLSGPTVFSVKPWTVNRPHSDGLSRRALDRPDSSPAPAADSADFVGAADSTTAPAVSKPALFRQRVPCTNFPVWPGQSIVQPMFVEKSALPIFPHVGMAAAAPLSGPTVFSVKPWTVNRPHSESAPAADSAAFADFAGSADSALPIPQLHKSAPPIFPAGGMAATAPMSRPAVLSVKPWTVQPVPRSRERCRIASQPPRRRAPGGARGGTNRSDMGLNLSGSWQQGHSATYNTPSRI